MTLAQEAEVLKWNGFEPYLNYQNDTTYVINFWATWCKPCVKELPALDSLNATFASNPVRVILVSMDFKSQLNSHLNPFIIEKDIQSNVLLLDEIDYDKWINKVDSTWKGAIPATLIYNYQKRFRKFYVKEFTFAEIEKIINNIIKQ